MRADPLPPRDRFSQLASDFEGFIDRMCQFPAIQARLGDFVGFIVAEADGLGHGFITDEFAANTTGRVRIRESRPGMAEYSADAPPLNFGVIETFFRKHL